MKKSSSNDSNVEEGSAAARRVEARSSSSGGEAAREKEAALLVSDSRRRDSSSSSSSFDVTCALTRDDVGFCIGDCVSVYRHPKRAEEVVIEWMTSPTGDMVADAVSFLLLDILRTNGSSDTSQRVQQQQQLLCDREQQSDAVLIDVLQAQLSHAFGAVQVLPRSVRTPERAAKAAAPVALDAAAAAAAKACPAAVVGDATAAVAATDGDAAAAAAAPNAHAVICVRAATADETNLEAVAAAAEQQQQQNKKAQQEEEEQQRVPAAAPAIERTVLVEGEVLMRFWARRLTPAATAAASVGSTEQPEDKQQAAAESPEKKRTAGVLVPVEIDVAMRTVHCDDLEVRQRVQAFVRRVEASLLPLPLFF